MSGHAYGISDAIVGTEDHHDALKKRAAFKDSFSRSKSLQSQGLMNKHLEKASKIMARQAEEGRIVDVAYVYRGAPADIFTEFIFGQQFNFIDDEESTRGLYHRKHKVVFGMLHLGRWIYPMIPLVCDLLWQQVKQICGGNKPKWSILTYLSWAKKAVQQLQADNLAPIDEVKPEKIEPVMSTFMAANLSPRDKSTSMLALQGMAAWSGGWETVGTTMTVGTYKLLRHPLTMNRLQSELRAAWPDTTVPPEMSALDSCGYLTAVIKESLRFTSPPCRLSRYNPKETERYGPYTFPAGTYISVSLPMVNFDISIFGADAALFRPERWLDLPGENEGGKLDQWVVSFSKGTRICPGVEVAWVEMRLLFAQLLRRFDLSLAEDDEGQVIGDEDVMTYRDGFTGITKNWCQRLPVQVKLAKD